MCRLAILGNVTNFSPLARAFDKLDKALGGDGTGVYIPSTDEIIKGPHLTTGECAYHTLGAPLAMFHTRLATSGGLTEAVSHPFEAGEYILMHNGVWYVYEDFNYGDLCDSDTQLAASFVEEHGPGILLDPEFDGSGVWVVMHRESHYTYVLTRGSRDFYFGDLGHGAWMHASAECKQFKGAIWSKAKTNKVYVISPDGQYEETYIESKPMPEPMVRYVKPAKKITKKTGAPFGVDATPTPMSGYSSTSGIAFAYVCDDCGEDFYGVPASVTEAGRMYCWDCELAYEGMVEESMRDEGYFTCTECEDVKALPYAWEDEENAYTVCVECEEGWSRLMERGSERSELEAGQRALEAVTRVHNAIWMGVEEFGTANPLVEEVNPLEEE